MEGFLHSSAPRVFGYGEGGAIQNVLFDICGLRWCESAAQWASMRRNAAACGRTVRVKTTRPRLGSDLGVSKQRRGTKKNICSPKSPQISTTIKDTGKATVIQRVNYVTHH